MVPDRTRTEVRSARDFRISADEPTLNRHSVRAPTPCVGGSCDCSEGGCAPAEELAYGWVVGALAQVEEAVTAHRTPNGSLQLRLSPRWFVM